MSHLHCMHESHVTNMNESCHTYEWVISQIWMNHESCASYAWELRHSRVMWIQCIMDPQYTATHCNTLQHTATHCSALQHTATHHGPLMDSWVTWVIFLMRHVITKRVWRESERILRNHNSFHWICYIPETHQIDELRSLGISWYKFKLRFWLNLNLYREIWGCGFGGFRGTAFSVDSVIVTTREREETSNEWSLSSSPSLSLFSS